MKGYHVCTIDKTKGRGVKTTKPYVNEEVVSEASCLSVPDDIHIDTLRNTIFGRYYFEYNNKRFFAMGTISFINHSRDSNVKFVYNDERHTLAIVATRNIEIDEELLADYECTDEELKSYYGIL